MPVCKREYEDKYPPKIVDLRFNYESTWMLPKPLCYCLKLFLIILPLFAAAFASAQGKDTSVNGYRIHIDIVGKDSSFDRRILNTPATFAGQTEATSYINKLPALLLSKGYPAASIDSMWQVPGVIYLQLYPGPRYTLVNLNTSGIDKKALAESGIISRSFNNKPVNFDQIKNFQDRLLRYYENNGYPFASVYLDSITVNGDKISASLKVDPSVLYHVDSLRIIGNAKLSNRFLQQYLSVKNGSVYNKEKLEKIDQRITSLSYVTMVQPSDVTMLGNGSVLNLYLQPKKSSQVNFLVGFLPAAGEDKKLQLTGDVNLDLNNLLGSGERILFKWQQLQAKSPRLNIGFTQPYIFKSPFGLDFLFDLFKKDSSFLQINAQAGVQFDISANQWGKLFLQVQNTSLLSGGVDTNMIKSQKRLPPNIDVSSVNMGISYERNTTNYRFNPRNGSELSLISSVGIKKVKQSMEVLAISDPSFNYATLYDSVKPETYQLKARAVAAKYFPFGKFSVLKTALSGGLFISPSIFRNELFQLGGYRLLRGFDEESIYATRYGVLTAEYRYLVGTNSYFFFFVDGAMVKNKYQEVNVNTTFIGTGLGLSFETKLGLLNISYALGKRDDVKFNIREASKLHFGYINYF